MRRFDRDHFVRLTWQASRAGFWMRKLWKDEAEVVSCVSGWWIISLITTPKTILIWKPTIQNPDILNVSWIVQNHLKTGPFGNRPNSKPNGSRFWIPTVTIKSDASVSFKLVEIWIPDLNGSLADKWLGFGMASENGILGGLFFGTLHDSKTENAHWSHSCTNVSPDFGHHSKTRLEFRKSS